MKIHENKVVPGKRFDRLLVEVEVEGTSGVYWYVLCDCGVRKTVQRAHLTSGSTRSCGCLHREKMRARYSQHTSKPEYGIWSSMKARCNNQRTDSYPLCGGRGIKICDRWQRGENGLTGFECFLADMGQRPSSKHSIERIDNNGNYEPGNCEWASKEKQDRNKRINHWVEYKGQRMILADAIRVSGLPAKLVDNRLRRGWELERALSVSALSYDSDRMIMVEFRGRKMNLKAAAKEAGIKYHTVFARISKGWPAEKALNTKP